MKYLLFAQSLAVFASAHGSKEEAPDNSRGIPESVYIDFKLVDDDKMQIDVITNDNTWVGLILGSNMMTGNPYSDMIVFSANGVDNSKCVDLASDPGTAYVNVQPNEDMQQDVTCTFEEVNGQIKFTGTRKLDTGDTRGDFLIPVDE